MQKNTSAAAIPTFTLGDRLGKARQHAGLSQPEMGMALGLSRGSIARYEGDGGTPRMPIIIAWATVTGVDLGFLLPDLDSNQEPADFEPGALRSYLELAA